MSGACRTHGRVRNYKILVVEPEKNRLLGRHDINWRIILKCVLYKHCGRPRTEFIWLKIGTSGKVC
jgi:hypothetical protein